MQAMIWCWRLCWLCHCVWDFRIGAVPGFVYFSPTAARPWRPEQTSLQFKLRKSFPIFFLGKTTVSIDFLLVTKKSSTVKTNTGDWYGIFSPIVPPTKRRQWTRNCLLFRCFFDCLWRVMLASDNDKTAQFWFLPRRKVTKRFIFNACRHSMVFYGFNPSSVRNAEKRLYVIVFCKILV